MKRLLVAAAAAVAVSAAMIPVARATNDNGSKFTMAVYGDSPYGNTANSDQNELGLTPAFINQINADADVRLVAHVGDIHSGSDYCSLQYDQQIASLWENFEDPLVYTPGDNEWSDCWKTKEGIQDPLTNLGYVRDTFFKAPGQTLGRENMHVTSQATDYDRQHPEYKQYIENVMFENKRIMFVTLNFPGGSDNDTDAWGTLENQTAREAERNLRTAADLSWLDHAFATAATNGDKGLVIIQQADMWSFEETASHLGHYHDFATHIRDNTAAFGKPVLLFEGDSHKYRSDNPLQSGAPCVTESSPTTDAVCSSDVWDRQSTSLPAEQASLFHRVVVHGSTTPLQWIKLTVDANANNTPSDHAFGPFSWVRINTGLH